MDRGILEGDPHAVLEGMAIGAYAMGAQEGYVYCRAEYPLAIEHLKTAITQAEAYGLLGENIFGSDFSFKLKIREGAGAFVCGEETALIASIEGRVGEPRPRPPFPAQSGLWGKPTTINNVKTWSHIAPIIARGADWYASLGSGNSKGTTVFSLVGKVNNSGLVEVPLGITLREMIYDIGGGIIGDRAIQGGADRRPLGRLHPRGVPGHPGGLRLPGGPGLHHGLRRHDRHGRTGLHGERGQVLSRLHPGRVLRQVHPLPGRDPAAHGNAGGHHRGPGPGRRHRQADQDVRD